MIKVVRYHVRLEGSGVKTMYECDRFSKAKIWLGDRKGSIMKVTLAKEQVYQKK